MIQNPDLKTLTKTTKQVTIILFIGKRYSGLHIIQCLCNGLLDDTDCCLSFLTRFMSESVRGSIYVCWECPCEWIRAAYTGDHA